ncbi:hypothetical protein C7N43_36800 [Sphingobacteriales bacterium UPWRP_1]|nr:hypothetical protein B6N25_00520 [Sphingobacteriales bacterium TSM_CSS]PSJ71932.1 hypothetical protein C7N43_36800 [Sphingobacteriales bacterium UPWRP_1]
MWQSRVEADLPGCCQTNCNPNFEPKLSSMPYRQWPSPVFSEHSYPAAPVSTTQASLNSKQ